VKRLIDDVTAWNERWAREYDIDRYYATSHWIVRGIEERRLKRTVQLLDRGANEPVLELGCGAGHVLARFDEPRIGVEISPTMLSKSRSRLGPGTSLLRADVEQLPVRSGSVTSLVCTEVIEHVVHPERLLAEIERVLAPQGRAVITFPNESLIESVKRWLLRLRLFHRLAPSPLTSAEAEWHLHSFSPGLFQRLKPPSLVLRSMIPVPALVLPLRYVCLLERQA
jgi:ubiquinone/menaquinone biosynthesis C-methylase UbiE